MHGRPVSLALLLLAVAAGAAEPPGGAPLENSKQELRALQADQATKNSTATAGKLTDGLPALGTPTPGAVSLDFAPPKISDKESDKKKDAAKNWLLDGVDKLGRDAKARDRKDRQPTAAGDKKVLADGEDEPDSAEANSLLKVYAEQKKEAETKADARPVIVARSDPLAPFLQDWMGNSPVRGKFFDEFVRKPDASGTGVPASGLPDSNPNQSLGAIGLPDSNRATAPGAAQPNPYLQGLDLPGAADPGARNNSPAALPAFGPASVPAVPVPVEPLPELHPAEKKPLLLAPSDNQKYFPQQKKF